MIHSFSSSFPAAEGEQHPWGSLRGGTHHLLPLVGTPRSWEAAEVGAALLVIAIGMVLPLYSNACGVAYAVVPYSCTAA